MLQYKLDDNRAQEKILERAIKWIMTSGIQDKCGGFYSWYDIARAKYSFLYPEVTGYAIRQLVQLYLSSNSNKYLKNALKAGNWFLNIQLEDGGFYYKYVNNVPNFSRFTFDTGSIIDGLIDLYDVIGDKNYLKSAKQAADWILNLQQKDGSILAGLDENLSPIKCKHWSRTSGCHHIKTASILLRLYVKSRNHKYLNSAKRIIAWGNQLQFQNGRFRSYQQTKKTYLHAHCYALEGLVRVSNSIYFKKEVYNALCGAMWLSSIQNYDGSIPNWYNSTKENMKVSDAVSQALRIWTIFLRKGNINLSKNIQKGLIFLKSFQCKERVRAKGGIIYAIDTISKINHVNTCATLFFIQALIFINSNEKFYKLIEKLY